MSKIFCFGELLLRFAPALERKWIESAKMSTYIGGAELNVATALSNWNVPTGYCTVLPENYLSSGIIGHLNDKGIDTTPIKLMGSRIGTYYLPEGVDLKNAGVIYDRANSSFSELQPGVINWEEVLKGYTWFHFSAITPALSLELVAVCREAVIAARKLGLFISMDLNYRAKLWQYGKQPFNIVPSLVEHCDLVMGNIWAAEKMLGIPVPENMSDKSSYLEASRQTSEAILKTYERCKHVANTFRFDADDSVHYYATLHTNGEFVDSIELKGKNVVDRVGSGDCFMAGLIYSTVNKMTPQDSINFSASAAFKKLYVKGDATTSTVEDIRKTNATHV
jgi:2-dehydro-3-deoxygluconokinase